MNGIEIARLKKDDCKEVVEFLNRVFTQQNGREMHFEKMYPRIFKEDDNTMQCHIAAKKDGKICGVAASYPFKYHIGNTTLNVAAMGNVAVDEKMRGQGIMQELLKRACEKNKADGIDLCYLHGDRWRYRHFGFERCGKEICFHIKNSILRDFSVKKHYAFCLLKENNAQLLEEFYEFYNTQRTYEERAKETFYQAMTAKGHMTYIIKNGENGICGYITLGDDNSSVVEIYLENEESFYDVIKTFLTENSLETLYVNLSEFHPLTRKAEAVSDRYLVFQPGNFLILDLKKVTEAFMYEKCTYENLPDGVLKIDSDIFGKQKAVKKGEKITVEPFEGEADFTFKGYDIYKFLFGTLPAYGLPDNEKGALAKKWFPLPMYCPYLS